MENNQLRLIEKHSIVLRITHWLNVPLTVLMMWSGILIYWAHQAYIQIPDQIGPLKIHHRLAEGMGWHFFIMWPYFFNGILFVSNQFISGEWRELIPSKRTIKNFIPFILYDLHLSKKKPHFIGKFNPAQQVAYTGALFMGIGTIISGLAIYKPVQLGWLTALLGGYKAARFEHFLLMCGLGFFIVIHLIQVLRAGWNNFRAMVAGYELK